MRFTPGCLCCEPGDCCDDCPVRPAQWTVPLAGVTGTLIDPTGFHPLDHCNDCSVANDTYTITESSDCLWTVSVEQCLFSPTSSELTGENIQVFIRLYCYTDDIYYLEVSVRVNNGTLIGYESVAWYTLPRVDWECMGPNTLTLGGTDANIDTCENWPATLTVTAV